MRRQPSALSDSVTQEIVDHSSVTSIIDYSPEWAYTDGQTKVLITGHWYGHSNCYSCLFGNILVPATLIQTGVLRTKCPAHDPGTIQLSIVCDQQVISNSVPFVYRQQIDLQTTAINQSHIESLEFMRRLDELGNKLDGTISTTDYSQLNGDSIDRRAQELKCVEVTHKILSKLYNQVGIQNSNKQEKDTVSNSNGNLLHLAVKMRYHQLLTLLLRWRSYITNTRDQVPPCLKTELDICARNKDGATPLFLACRLGDVTMAENLLRVSCQPLTIADYKGRTPLGLARAMKSNKLVNVLLNRGFLHPKNFALSHAEEESTSRAIDATTLWVLSDGVTTTDQRLRSGNEYDYNQASTSQTKPEVKTYLLHPADRRAKFRHQVTVAGERLAPCAEHEPLPDFTRNITETVDVQRPNLYRTGKRASFGCENDLYNNEQQDDIEFYYQHSDCTDVITAIDDDEAMNDDRESEEDWFKEPLNVHISADIQIPDSPRMKEMWRAVTSPTGFVDLADSTKQQFANLAQAIINSLPNHIKLEPVFHRQYSEANTLTNSSGSQEWQQLPTFNTAFGNYSTQHKYATPPYNIELEPHSSCDDSVKINADFFEKSRNEILTNASPLQRDFEELRLSDREQRELYEAAKVIQNAFRQYKARVTTQRRQTAMEVQAAITIQSYYRRYKQYCYFKKLHNAAVMIQKHFRVYRQTKQGALEAVQQYDRKQADVVDPLDCNNPVYGREHAAAIRIQHAYRGHYERKRQAAARKIQKFMRESRKKLRQDQMGIDLQSKATMLGYASTLYASTAGNLATNSIINGGGANGHHLHRHIMMQIPDPLQHYPLHQ